MSDWYTPGKARMGLDEYFMGFAEAASWRTTCVRRRTGAVIVDKNNRIVSTGYNGNPAGMKHCIDIGCLRNERNIQSGTQQQLCRGVHAEQNVLLQAEDMSRVQGSTCYCLIEPCVICCKMLINAGVKRIVYKESYPDELGADMLSEAGVSLERYEAHEDS